MLHFNEAEEDLLCSFFHGLEQDKKRAVGGLTLVRAREDTRAWDESYNKQIRFFRGHHRSLGAFKWVLKKNVFCSHYILSTKK